MHLTSAPACQSVGEPGVCLLHQIVRILRARKHIKHQPTLHPSQLVSVEEEDGGVGRLGPLWRLRQQGGSLGGAALTRVSATSVTPVWTASAHSVHLGRLRAGARTAASTQRTTTTTAGCAGTWCAAMISLVLTPVRRGLELRQRRVRGHSCWLPARPGVLPGRLQELRERQQPLRCVPERGRPCTVR
jgi:hypothetical protein